MKTFLSKFTTFFCAVLMVMTAIVPVSVNAADIAEEEYYWPVPSSTVINSKNPYSGKSGGHWGIDINGGGDIAATKSGTVIIVYTGCKNVHGGNSKTGVTCKAAGICKPSFNISTAKFSNGFCNNGYGNGVIIKHKEKKGYSYSMYAHLKSVSVKVGDEVNQGDIIGVMGSSGTSSGTHLHFELAETVLYEKADYKKNTYVESNKLINPTPGKQINYIYSLGTPVTLNYCDANKTTERVYIENATYGTLKTPKNPGYIFQGWYTSQKGGKKVTASTSLINDKAHTLYAQWTPCNHNVLITDTYVGGICIACGHEYAYKITALKAATPYKVTKKDGAPVWSRPYSNNSTKLGQIKNGAVVMVVAKTMNQAENEWYLLSDGSWIFAGNVKKATASNIYYAYNTSGYLCINKKASSGSEIGRIPEGASVTVNTSKSTKNWLYVTYNGVSGYAYKSYLTTTAPQISIYQCKQDTKILESKKSNAKSRGTLPAYTDFVVFTNRTNAKDSYYAVYYNNKIAGYIPKNSAVKVK